MITWGINALNHDASIAVVKDGELIFWKRSSEYTDIPGDQFLCRQLIQDATKAGGAHADEVVWYENAWLKKTRQLYAGQYRWAFNYNELPKVYLKKVGIRYNKFSYVPHHLSHAAAGYLTSPFKNAVIVVLDALGEWESSTIWYARGRTFEKVWSRKYPTSLGLFYSAFTDLIGLKPISEEHELQKLSDQGNPTRYKLLVKDFWTSDWELRQNLHRGVRDWKGYFQYSDRADVAAAVQEVFEKQAQKVFDIAKEYSDNLVYMGGCAMNSKFNKKLEDQFNGIWSLPVPGDSASAIGCALHSQNTRIKWNGPIAKHIKIKYNN